MPQVYQNHQGHIALEVHRTSRKIFAISKGDCNFRRIKEFTHEQFNANWKPIDHDPCQAALKWLEWSYNKYIPLSEAARKELIMILVFSENNKLVAKFADDQMATAIASVPPTSIVVSDPSDMCGTYTAKELQLIYNNLNPDVPQVIGVKVRNKEQLAEEIYKQASAIALEIKRPVEKVVVTKATGSTTVKIKPAIRAILESGVAISMPELMERFGADKKNTIQTALSDLQSAKYCGEAGPIIIAKDADKRYHIAKEA